MARLAHVVSHLPCLPCRASPAVPPFLYLACCTACTAGDWLPDDGSPHPQLQEALRWGHALGRTQACRRRACCSLSQAALLACCCRLLPLHALVPAHCLRLPLPSAVTLFEGGRVYGAEVSAGGKTGRAAWQHAPAPGSPCRPRPFLSSPCPSVLAYPPSPACILPISPSSFLATLCLHPVHPSMPAQPPFHLLMPSSSLPTHRSSRS